MLIAVVAGDFSVKREPMTDGIPVKEGFRY
jgi:hypothetical protein